MNIQSQKKHAFGAETLDEAAKTVIAIINSKTSNGVLGFAWDLRRHEHVSNSYHAPLNGVTNWSRHGPDNPTGYPGWTGRVWIRYTDSPKSFGSDLFGSTRTYTGSGGFGSYDGPWAAVSRKRYDMYACKKSSNLPEIRCYSWDYRIFESDWPELALNCQREKMWQRLGGPPSSFSSHYYLFEDTATKKQDEQFLKAEIECLTS